MTSSGAHKSDPATPHPRTEDRRARRLAQCEFDRPLLLEAGAGTGKTTTLVARVLAWCLGPGWRLHEGRLVERARELGRREPPAADEIASEVLERVVAITFTEEAAAEMARRVASELGRLADPTQQEPPWLDLEASRAADPADGREAEREEGPEESRPGTQDSTDPEPGAEPLSVEERAHRAAALLTTLDRLAVRTIHAFCRGLLADHPLEARLHPDLAVDADGTLLEELARETVEGRLRRLYGTADVGSAYLALAAQGVGPRELVEALVVLSQAGLPANALDGDPFPSDKVERLTRRVVAGCRRVHQQVDPLLGEIGRAKKAPDVCAALAALAGRLEERLGEGLATEAAAPNDDPSVETPRSTTEPAAPGPEGVSALRSLLADLDELLPPSLRDHLKTWKGWRMGAGERSGLAPIRQDLVAAATDLGALLKHLQALDPTLLALAQEALAPLHRQVRGEMRARGVVTFEDLLAEAAHLLARRPGVATGVRRRIDQLLVDEFQDTDALQCEIVAALGLRGPRQQRPGLFLVGDPKQSIYGWRSADLAAYDRFRRRIADAGGEILPLVENFRSVPAILEEVERSVAPVMHSEPGFQPPFQPLLPCARLADQPGFSSGSSDANGDPAPTDPRRSAVEYWVPWSEEVGASGSPCGPQTTRGRSFEIEADAVARDIRHLHETHGVAWNRVAILLRSTTDLDLYLEGLRRYGVPFAVGRDKQYYRRREVIDAAALVRCVLDPGDHLALLTVLRSPWVGVPDAALVPLWNRGFPDLMHRLLRPRREDLESARTLAEGAAADLSSLAPGDVPGLERVAGWELSLRAAVEQLAVARQAFREQPADAFVHTLRRLFLPEPVAAARYLGAYRLANLERFFRRLVTALEDGGGDVTAVLRALRRSVAEAREAPEGRPGEGADDAVQVMTIHQAKGLDFAHVYLPQLHKGSRGGSPATEVHTVLEALDATDEEPLDPREAGDSTPGEFIPEQEIQPLDARYEFRLFGAPSLGFDRIEARRDRVDAAERVRLLYVAMTRAEERMVLSAGWQGEAPRLREPRRADSFLDLLAHRPDQPDPPLADAWQAGAADLTDATGTLWRFPVRATWPRNDPAQARKIEAPDPVQVAAASRRLEERTRRAAVQRSRPYSTAASADAHHRLAMLLGEEGRSRGDRGPGTAVDPTGREEVSERDRRRAIALTVGHALHRYLEELDLETVTRTAAANSSLAEADSTEVEDLVRTVAEPELDKEDREEAQQEVRQILKGLMGGVLLTRLRSLGPDVLGREVPVILEPPDLAPREAVETAKAPGVPLPPVGFYGGAVDLLYRDPEDGGIVVADYKTDAVEGQELEARAAAYASQGRVYIEAVTRALGLAQPPRFELWFLRADRVVTVEPPSLSPPPPPPPSQPRQHPEAGAPAEVNRDAVTRDAVTRDAVDQRPRGTSPGGAETEANPVDGGDPVDEESGPAEQIALFDLHGLPSTD